LYNFCMAKKTPPSISFDSPPSLALMLAGRPETPLSKIVVEILKQIDGHPNAYKLAQESGVVTPTVYNIRKGEVPSLTTLLQIDLALNAKEPLTENQPDGDKEDEKS
jgi:hypothetical protein